MPLSHLLLPHGKDPKSPHDIVITFEKMLINMKKRDSNLEKCKKDVSINMKRIRVMLYGTLHSLPESERFVGQLIEELYKTDVLMLSIETMEMFSNETRKDFVFIFCFNTRQQIGTRRPSVEYIRKKKNIETILIQKYSNNDLCLAIGQIIRECLRFERLALKYFDERKLYLKFFDFIENESFAISSDALLTLHTLLTAHKPLFETVLLRDYQIFFQKLSPHLVSDNLFVKRKSVQLLSEILLDRNHTSVMKEFVIKDENLVLIEKLLKDSYRSVSSVAFKIFELFVLNPKMTDSIKSKLITNKEAFIESVKQLEEKPIGIELKTDENEGLIKKLNELSFEKPKESEMNDNRKSKSKDSEDLDFDNKKDDN